jgi:hypothetical protein
MGSRARPPDGASQRVTTGVPGGRDGWVHRDRGDAAGVAAGRERPRPRSGAAPGGTWRWSGQRVGVRACWRLRAGIVGGFVAAAELAECEGATDTASSLAQDGHLTELVAQVLLTLFGLGEAVREDAQEV